MKRTFSLLLALFMLINFTACSSPVPQPNLSQNETNKTALLPQIAPSVSGTPLNDTASVVSVADINTKVDIFDLMLMIKGNDGVVNPITPEQIESLRIDGKTVAPSGILLPGSTNASAFSSEKAVQEEASNVLLKNQPWVIYGDNAVYTIALPKSESNNKLEFKLKNDPKNYELVRVANLSRGSFILNNGELEGAFSIRNGFQIKPTAVEYAVMLSLIIVVCLVAITTLGSKPNTGPSPSPKPSATPTPSSSPAQVDPNLFPTLSASKLNLKKERESYYALSGFQANNFSNYYQSTKGQAVITTQDKQKMVFAANNSAKPLSQMNVSTLDLQNARQQVQASIGESINPMLGYVGAWVPESELVTTLIPGGTLTLQVTKRDTNRYGLSALLATDTYSGEGEYAPGSNPDEPLRLSVNANQKSLDLQFRLVSPNRLGVTVLKATGAPELAAVVGQEILFKRKL